MGALREKMIAEMKLRNFAGRTQKSYLAAMVGLAKHYRQFPDQLTQEQIRTYVLQLQERGLSSSSLNVNISGLRFFYQQVLGWNQEQFFLPRRKRMWRLPEVLSPREVEQLLSCAVKLRDRCLLMTAYSAGLRVTELIHLKLSDIDPERMMIRVEQGKGKKDRYTILSQRLLGEMKKYKPINRCCGSSSVKAEMNPCTSAPPRRSITALSRKAALRKAKASTRSDTVLPPIC